MGFIEIVCTALVTEHLASCRGRVHRAFLLCEPVVGMDSMEIEMGHNEAMFEVSQEHVALNFSS